MDDNSSLYLYVKIEVGGQAYKPLKHVFNTRQDTTQHN